MRRWEFGYLNKQMLFPWQFFKNGAIVVVGSETVGGVAYLRWIGGVGRQSIIYAGDYRYIREIL